MKRKNAAKLLAVPVVGAALFTEELYRYLFCRRSSKLFTKLFDSKGHEDNYYAVRDAAADRLRAAEHQEYTIRSRRGEELKGFYYPCGGEGKRIAFVIHGYRSEHAETAGMFYDCYKSRGIDLFCCDHTASGVSGGAFIGFDVLETEDCLEWVRFLLEQFGPEVQLILHGLSMGAATVMQMSSRCPENVRFIIEDSGFMNARASLDHQIGPMYQPMRAINRAVAGYDLDRSDVRASLAAATVPILFVHGKEDRLVPYENGPALCALYQGEKDCFFPPNTRHIESIYTSPLEYGEKIDRFVEKYFRPEGEAQGIQPSEAVSQQQ